MDRHGYVDIRGGWKIVMDMYPISVTTVWWRRGEPSRMSFWTAWDDDFCSSAGSDGEDREREGEAVAAGAAPGHAHRPRAPRGGFERPALRYGHVSFTKRGEDYFLVKPNCLRVPADLESAFSIFAVHIAGLSLH